MAGLTDLIQAKQHVFRSCKVRLFVSLQYSEELLPRLKQLEAICCCLISFFSLQIFIIKLFCEKGKWFYKKIGKNFPVNYNSCRLNKVGGNFQPFEKSAEFYKIDK